MAPNLKGRPRKKKPCSLRRDSFNGVKDSSNNCDGQPVAKVKCEAKSALPKPKSNNNNCKKPTEECPKVTIGEECRAEEQAFLVALYKYMKERKTPIERIPYLGFKQINLWTMFQAAQKLGGYETITARRQWKHIYDELGGNPGSTSAATCTRRHYERLILPYERCIKGEEDKPLPPVKPRKQEPSSQEVETKAKVSGDKQIKVENKKGKKEKDDVQKPQETSEVSLEQERSQEAVEEESTISDVTALEEVKNTPKPEATGLAAMETLDLLEANCNQDILEEEAKEQQQVHDLSDLVASKEALELETTNEQTQTDNLSATKQESIMQNSTDPTEIELQEAPCNILPDIQVHLQNQNCMEDDNLPHLPDYIANCTVKMDPLGSEEFKSPMNSNILKDVLKQNTRVYVVQSLDVLKEKELPISVNDNPTFSYTPLVYSRGNPGIMSPLAKKKLLSQVSGAFLASSYPYGSPPPLISKKRSNGRDELPISRLQTSQGCNTEPTAISRPSVIQHVQSFKTKNGEERTPINDFLKQSLLSKSDAYRCDFSKHRQNSHVDSYVLKPDIHDFKGKFKKRPGQHSRVNSFLADFYSSPHLHRLYKQTEHHLNSEQAEKHLSRDMLQESESISTFGQHKHQEKSNLRYHPPLHQQEKQPASESSTDDQPTDLSLPKTINKQSKKMLVSKPPHTMVQQESKPVSQFNVENSHTVSSDGNPKACRVSPMAMSTQRKHATCNPRSGTSQNFRLNSLRWVEGTVHPMPSSEAQNIGTARPLKRSLDDSHNDAPKKKIRVVSPLRLQKETTGRETFFHHGGERSKSVHDVHSDSSFERHKYAISSPMLPGLYPGTLCAGLSSRIPASYSHLQYLKNQTVYSPVMQPLTLQSLMMQRQFLASSANSQQLYRHLAAGTPVGSSYGELLNNNIYPIASINPQNIFPPSQLSSGHPSTPL